MDKEKRKKMEDEARRYGEDAALNDLPRIPALDLKVEDLLEGLEVGESATILNAWLEGYDSEINRLTVLFLEEKL